MTSRTGTPPRTGVRHGTRGYVLPAMLLALAALGPVGCANSPSVSDDTSRPTAAAAQRGDQAAPAVPAGGFNDTDRGWAQLMTPMNERTLLLLDLIGTRASDPALSDFAGRTAVTHRAELTRLRAVLRKTGATGANPHEGHDMKGMVTDAELGKITALDGKAFDDIAMTYLREHLEQSVLVSEGEQRAGAAAEAKSLAGELAGRRAGQLEALRLLGGW